jgi:hypothetical protein
LVFVLGLIALTPACSRRKSHNERLQQQWNAKVKELADLLAGVTDPPAANAAVPKLEKAVQELERVEKELRKYSDPEDVDPSEQQPMTEAVVQGIAEMQRLNVEILRISKSPELVTALGQTWRKIPDVPMLEAAGAIPKSK